MLMGDDNGARNIAQIVWFYRIGRNHWTGDLPGAGESLSNQCRLCG